MEKVAGIGGIFFRGKDPAKLAEWYKTHLGVDPVPSDYDTMPWQTEAGITVFAPFPSDTEYFGGPEQQFMINFRVHDLDAMVAQLKAGGIEVNADGAPQPNGKFATLYDLRRLTNF